MHPCPAHASSPCPPIAQSPGPRTQDNLLHAAETGACVHSAQSQSAKVPESHFRTAPHVFDPIRPFTSYRPSDRLHASLCVPQYHHLLLELETCHTLTTRATRSRSCVHTYHSVGPSQLQGHRQNRPQSLSSSPPLTSAHSQKARAPSAQPPVQSYRSRLAQPLPRRRLRSPFPSPNLTAPVYALGSSEIGHQKAHARPLALSTEAHASTTSTNRILPGRVDPLLFSIPTRTLDPDLIPDPPNQVQPYDLALPRQRPQQEFTQMPSPT